MDFFQQILWIYQKLHFYKTLEESRLSQYLFEFLDTKPLTQLLILTRQCLILIIHISLSQCNPPSSDFPIKTDTIPKLHTGLLFCLRSNSYQPIRTPYKISLTTSTNKINYQLINYNQTVIKCVSRKNKQLWFTRDQS